MKNLFAAALIMGAASLAVPAIPRASPIEYELKHATANYDIGSTVTVEGSFVFDILGFQINNVHIRVSGATDLLTVSPEVFTQGAPWLGPTSFNFSNPSGDDSIVITFATALSIIGSTPITSIDILGGPTTKCPAHSGGCASLSATGFADPANHDPSPVPEPPALALLGGALGIFLVGQRADRKLVDPA
jgi:hypothetical protein